EHFIGGAFVPPRAGRYLETWNPATGKRLGEIARGDGADVDAAVAAAGSAWPGWRDRRPIERGRVLLEIARRLRERQQEIATLEIARMAVECGLPAGALDVVTGTGPEAGAALVAHGGVRKVAFTGSLRAGREIAHLAADRILPLTLELGGKSPNLVFADADLERAVPGSLRAFVTNAGQVCSAGTRLLLERGIHDGFVQALSEAVKSVRPGQVLGPMTTEAQYRK